jgi:adenine phosphoribosyltransferase
VNRTEKTIRSLIRDVPDFPKPGILFKDITPLVGSPEGFRAAIGALARRYRGGGIARIAGIESRGFVFGAALADRLGVGFVPIRKPGKLPYRTRRERYALEYGTDAVEMHVDAVRRGERVLIVDDLLATGGTAAAAVRLVRGAGARVAEVAFVVELAFLGGRKRLGRIPVFSLVTYD